jgi:hypothetical protein
MGRPKFSFFLYGRSRKSLSQQRQVVSLLLRRGSFFCSSSSLGGSLFLVVGCDTRETL